MAIIFPTQNLLIHIFFQGLIFFFFFPNQKSLSKNGKQYDLILDIAGYHSVFDYKRALKSKGIYSIVGGSRFRIFQVLFIGSLISLTGDKKKWVL